MIKLLKGKPVIKKLARKAGDRSQKVAETAYFLAEKRGFEPGRELDDWFLAENMVDSGAQAGARG